MASQREAADVDPGRAALRIGAGAVVLATLATLFLGYLLKRPCVSGDWSDGRQYGTFPCYTDLLPIWGSDRTGPEGELIGKSLQGGGFPYLDAENEYPVLTGVVMAIAAWPAQDGQGFFHATAVLLAAAAVGTALLLRRMVGARALYFALAPTLLIYGFMSWDLVAVVLATLALYAYVRGRDTAPGAFLGLGAAAKLYPGLLVVPLAAGRLRDPERAGAVRVAGAAALAWVAANLPFALASPERWSTFFEFNSARGADWDSLWFLISEQAGFQWPPFLLNLLSSGTFVTLALVLWNLKSAREPDFPAWSFALPLVIAFLLTNKVYSPQYGLWLLPLFALSLANLPLFAAFQAADVAVFFTRFRFFAELDPGIEGGVPFGAFKAALLVRAAVLVGALVVWVRTESDPTAEVLALRDVERPPDASPLGAVPAEAER